MLNPKLIKGPWVNLYFNSDQRRGSTGCEAGQGAWTQELELYRQEPTGKDRKAMPRKVAQPPEPRH